MVELEPEASGNNHRRIPRSRTVSSRHYDFERGPLHPYIRLGGKYLEAYGFKIGDRIELHLEWERLTITKAR